MTQDEDKSLLKFLQEQEAKGYIRPSISPYASPFFFIQKKDGKLRPVQDYRRINDITISNQYPLPLITDLLTDLSRAKIFTKLDVKDGYNNIRIKEGDEHKAAFKTKYGLWEPLVMFFGLKNSPATFQNMMNYEYRDTIDYLEHQGNSNTHLHGRYCHRNQHQSGRSYPSSISSIRSSRTPGPIFQTREMYFPCPTYGLPGGNP
jgi:hypothetical protein